MAFYRWKDGPSVMICYDITGGSSSTTGGFSGPPWVRTAKGVQTSANGRRFDWELEGTDGQGVKCRLDGKDYDLAQGTLFLVKTKGGKTEVEQLNRDLSAVRPDSESLKGFAREDPAVNKFLLGTVAEATDPQVTRKSVSDLGGKFLAQGQRSSWSPDGKKIVFGRSGNDRGLLIHDIATHKTTPFTTAGKDPAWAGNDGRWIAYVTGSGTAEAIWAAEVPDGKPFRLAAGCMPSCSADGKTLFFQAFAQNQVMSSEITGHAQFSPPRLRAAVSYRYPAVSPDGKRLAYRSGGNLVIQRLDGGKAVLRFVLPKANGILGGWSPDSREFGFGGWNADDPMPCIILDVETGMARQVASRGLTLPAWSPDGTKITFDLRLSTGTEIWIVDAEVIKKIPTFTMEVR